MIHVRIDRDREGSYKGFQVSGHSGYAQAGADIVCAAVSALVINAINSIEQFTADHFDCSMEEEAGDISFVFADTVSPESKLLMDSMILGLTAVRDEQGYLEIIFKEV